MLNFGPDIMFGSTFLDWEHLWILLVKQLLYAVFILKVFTTMMWVLVSWTNYLWYI